MKRKYLLGLPPVQPTSKKEEFTVKVDDDLIVIWRWNKKQIEEIYAINVVSGEHEIYERRSDIWHKSKLASLLGQERYGPCYLSSSKKQKFAGEVSEACALAEKHSPYRYNNGDLERLIDGIEDEYGRNLRERRENNRIAKIDRLMSSVPDLPKDFEDWLLKTAGIDRFYSLPGKDGRMYCSCCGEGYSGEKKSSGQNTVCPNCGAALLVDKRRKNGIEKDVHAALLQNINAEISVARHFDITIFHNKKRVVHISESERLILYRNDPKFYSKVFYAQQPRGAKRPDFDDRRNHYNRQVFNGYLYPGGIKEALAGTIYEPGIRTMEVLAESGVKLHYGKVMSGVIDERVARIMEYLHKGRFHKLLQDVAESCAYWLNTRGKTYLAGLYLDGEDLEEIFELGRQNINRLRDKNGGEKALDWLRWSERHEKKINDETLTWLTKNHMSRDEDIFQSMTPTQVMNYVTRQQVESYSGKTVKQVLDQWDDYMSMCRRLGKDTTDEMVYRPRELKRRHDECVEELRKRQAVIDMQNNRGKSEERAAKLRSDYPKAEEILRDIKEKYEYASDEYQVIVPNNLVEITLEGHALHHCVASSDRYFERIERRETYICFLRRRKEPETPFYTIEIEPGGTIRQHRSYFDEEPGIEEIRGFLKEWQQVIKKRLSEEDRRLAKESKKLRERNIQELKEKNNTRVLLGLMEDFMEAV